MKVKARNKIITAACTCAILAAAAVPAVLFASAKPVFGSAAFRPVPEKIIMAYTFDGMTFPPALELAAKNYPPTDEGWGRSSRTSTFINDVNQNIEKALAEYLDGNYSEYYVHAGINENTREKTVMVFHGDGVPAGGGERAMISFKLSVDWSEAKKPDGGDFVEIS